MRRAVLLLMAAAVVAVTVWVAVTRPPGLLFRRAESADPAPRTLEASP